MPSAMAPPLGLKLFTVECHLDLLQATWSSPCKVMAAETHSMEHAMERERAGITGSIRALLDNHLAGGMLAGR